jgi:hypothetical protein
VKGDKGGGIIGGGDGLTKEIATDGTVTAVIEAFLPFATSRGTVVVEADEVVAKAVAQLFSRSKIACASSGMNDTTVRFSVAEFAGSTPDVVVPAS